MPSKDNLYNGRKGIGFENPSYFEKIKDLRSTLYVEKVIGLGYTLMFLTHSDEALEIEKFKRSRENKIEFAYDCGNLNASYVNEKINFEDDYFQEIINPYFEKIDSPFQKTIESLKSKGFESSETVSSKSENQSENDCHMVEKQCGNMESSKVIAPGMFKLNVSQCVSPISMSKSSCDYKNVEIKLKRKRRNRKSSKQNVKQVDNDVSRANNDFVHFSDLDTFSSVRRPKNSGVIWKKRGSSNTLMLVCLLLCDVLDDNNFFIFDDENVRISPVSKMPFRKKPRDYMNMRSKSTMNKSLPRTVHKWLPKFLPLAEHVAKWFPRIVQICLWIIDSGCSKHMTDENEEEPTPTPTSNKSNRDTRLKAKAKKNKDTESQVEIKKRARNAWTQNEELLLAESFIQISEDPKTGCHQQKDTFWYKILDVYNTEAKRRGFIERTKNMLTGKWTPMNASIQKFNQLVAKMLALSGESDEDWITRVEILYKTHVGTEFKHKSAWLFLKGKHKWTNPESTNVRRYRFRVTDEEPEHFGDDALPRPPELQRIAKVNVPVLTRPLAPSGGKEESNPSSYLNTQKVKKIIIKERKMSRFEYPRLPVKEILGVIADTGIATVTEASLTKPNSDFITDLFTRMLVHINCLKEDHGLVEFADLEQLDNPDMHVDSVRMMNLFHKIKEVIAALDCPRQFNLKDLVKPEADHT
nr:kinetochore protein Nuf2-like isoform X1 [Tanacetum cinerariifolium]